MTDTEKIEKLSTALRYFLSAGSKQQRAIAAGHAKEALRAAGDVHPSMGHGTDYGNQIAELRERLAEAERELTSIRAAIGRMPFGTLPPDVEKAVSFPNEYYETELHKAEELAASYRHALRVISFNLSQGMGGDDTTADELHQRIQDGINTVTRVERSRAVEPILESLRTVRSHLLCGGDVAQAVAELDALLGKVGG